MEGRTNESALSGVGMLQGVFDGVSVRRVFVVHREYIRCHDPVVS